MRDVALWSGFVLFHAMLIISAAVNLRQVLLPASPTPDKETQR